MAYRFKSRATATYHFKSGTMVQFTSVNSILSSATRGDGDAGVYHEATTDEVKKDVAFGAGSVLIGTFQGAPTFGGHVARRA